MSRFDVTLIGVNSALPVNGRHPSCQIINHNEQLIMIDCGEGSQSRLTTFGIRRMKIEHILISHLHGDHCYGLPGLLTSYALYNREKTLHLHGPVGLEKYITTVLDISGAYLPYTLIIQEYNHEESSIIKLSNYLVATTFPLQHRIPTIGYRLDEVNIPRNINTDKIREHRLSVDEIQMIKAGTDITREDRTITAEECLLPPRKPRSYAYCSDTVYDPSIVTHIDNTTLLYHEKTYLKENEKLARQRGHSTLEEAVDIALKANATRLISGHYSSRYHNLSEFEERGKALFDGFILGKEGDTHSV